MSTRRGLRPAGDHGLSTTGWSALGGPVVADGAGVAAADGRDRTITSIDFAGTHYTFAKDVTLTDKDQCKNGGWATSYPTTYKNQGDCVSSFASKGKNKN